MREDVEVLLGKITFAEFGYGGYQNAMMGLDITLSSGSNSCGDFKGYWEISIDSHNAQWTETDRDKSFAKTVRFINSLLSDAKKTYVSELKGVPVEIKIKDNRLESWRILTEVL